MNTPVEHRLGLKCSVLLVWLHRVPQEGERAACSQSLSTVNQKQGLHVGQFLAVSSRRSMIEIINPRQTHPASQHTSVHRRSPQPTCSLSSSQGSTAAQVGEQVAGHAYYLEKWGKKRERGDRSRTRQLSSSYGKLEMLSLFWALPSHRFPLTFSKKMKASSLIA